MAIENYNWTCSCIKWYRWWVLSWQDYCISGSSYCYNNFGINSEYDYLYDSCKCRKLYMDLYWLMAIDNYDWTCSCTSWYVFSIDIFGNKSCVYWNTECKKKYWINSSYNELSNKCDCKAWYTIKTDSFWNQSCEEKNNHNKEEKNHCKEKEEIIFLSFVFWKIPGLLGIFCFKMSWSYK